MLLKELFDNDITRDIPPVVYFHEQDPAKVDQEVSEYIITGGYPEDDPRYRYIQKAGIHEQFVKLLKNLAVELQKPGGTELPSSWISGFYGSGKSSFAKLLGLAFDDLALPDGRLLSEALLNRDTSPKTHEFKEAWNQVRSLVNPIAVVFDIGVKARDDEQIHNAIKREIQKRLGYCSVSHHVAEHELKLELAGQWDAFVANAEKTLGEPWSVAKDDPMADESFSEVMHQIDPNRYIDPLSWYESRAGSGSSTGSSVEEVTTAIADMLRFRAPGKTVFIVVDEVSQYIFQSDNKMLALQSFVLALGQRLKGKVWLLATGQQKLEDSDDANSIGRLKDRFPPKLRVHLSPTNIRDVVHKRLLKKFATKETELRALFQTHRSDLKLYGYQCETLTEEEFVEVYPLLPGYVDLLMQITSNLRSRSTRAKGDDHAIRGLLQLLGEIFREQKLGEQPVGLLIAIDNIFDVQQSALDNDVQNTLTRLFSHEQVINNPMTIRVAKAVSLLELIQEQEPTSIALVSRCLYDHLGLGNQESAVTQALELLRSLNLVSYSEKTGYKIQSSSGQEWARERESYSVIPDAISLCISEKLKGLIGSLDRPKYKGKPFYWAALYSDGRQRNDERLQVAKELAVVTVDFRYLRNQDERKHDTWIQASAGSRDRILWVVGNLEDLEMQARELERSRHMFQKYQTRQQSLSRDKQRLLFDEQSRYEGLEDRVKAAVVSAFMNGELYFRGRQIDKQSYGSGFSTLLNRVGEALLPELFSQYVEVAVTTTELTQLLEPNLSGPSQKFMQDGLGILELDAGKYAPNCQGEVPARIERYITDENGISGTALLTYFGGPPYGYPADVVKACLAGLLRGAKIRIRPETGAEITSVRDPGARDLFTKDRDLKRADILPPNEGGITGRDRIALRNFFKDALGIDLETENDAIADAVFRHFPNQAQRLRELEQRYNRLPNRPDLPNSLVKLQQALEKCRKSPQVKPTLLEVKRHLDVLRDGIRELGILLTDLTDEAVAAVATAMTLQDNQVKQMRQIERCDDVSAAVTALEEQLELERPWRDISSLDSQLKAISDHYQAVRLGLIERQEQQAEEIRHRIQQRSGYLTLSEEEASQVLAPLQSALYDTTPDALYPALLELRDTSVLRLQTAEEQANTALDNALSKTTDEQVIQVPIELKGREVSTPEEVEVLVDQLRERLLSQLEGKANVRIRLI